VIGHRAIQYSRHVVTGLPVSAIPLRSRSGIAGRAQ
jgi:hypothetical protein